MIDETRMAELRMEVGSEDLAMILDVYFVEAADMLATLSDPMLREDMDKALHFLRSGALNLGLSGFAEAATGPAVDIANLTSVFHATRAIVAESA